MFKSKWTFPFLCVLLLVETFCYYTALPFFTAGSLAYFFSGILIAVFPLFFSIQAEKQITNRIVTVVQVGFFLLFANWMFNLFRLDVLQGPPPIKEHADMLLFVKVMAERFLSGDAKIYAKITEVWGVDSSAPYLPAMWLPYALPIALGQDLRWASFLFVILSILLAFISVHRSGIKWTWQLAILPSLALLINRLISQGCWYFTQTEEGVVILYYTLICVALIWTNWNLVGIALALCLLSRFLPVIMIPSAVILLLPLYKTDLRKILFYSITTVLLIILFSGTFDEIVNMASIPFKYRDALNNNTNLTSIEELNNKLGMAKFFAQPGIIFKGMSVPVTLVATLIFAFALKKWNPDVRIEYQLLCLLKLTLVFFLNFQIGVDEYLLYTSSIVSLFIVIGYSNSLRKNILNAAS